MLAATFVAMLAAILAAALVCIFGRRFLVLPGSVIQGKTFLTRQQFLTRQIFREALTLDVLRFRMV